MTLSLLVLLGACGVSTPSAPPDPPPPAAAPPATLVGSSACARCHPDETTRWRGSHHAQADRTVAQVTDGPPGAFTVTLPDASEPLAYARVLGVAPLWQPMLDAEGGRLQVSSRAWVPAEQRWVDVFADDRQPGDWGHWTGRGMTWNSQCAACHDTGVTRGWDPASDVYTTEVAELGVGCEACHGPGSLHVADPTVATTAPVTPEALDGTCGSCHVRWTPATEAHVPGEALLQHGLPALPGLQPDWHVDGQILDESFEAVAFRSSAKHAAGVRCTTCHDPHGATLRQPAQTLCTTCHPDAPAHTRHPEGSPGAACVACHMPTTTYMAVHARHDHGFRIPDPALTLELGVPNACDRCHDDTAASAAAASTWWSAPEAQRLRARALHAARTNAADADQRIADALAAEAHPFWQAVLTAVEPSDLARRRAAAASPDPWMRRAAAMDLPPNPEAADLLLGLLADEVRAVRLEAATSLQPALPPDDPRMGELNAHLQARGDHAVAAHALGTWWLGHGRAQQALPFLRRAAALDPASVDAWRSLAIAQSTLGDAGGAAATLAEAVSRLPDAPELRFLLGLARAGEGRPQQAVEAFRDALRLDPTHARAANNLGLALRDLGDTAGALEALQRATELAPGDPNPPYALATVRLAAGDVKGARAAAELALARDPAHGPSLQLSTRLPTP